MDDAINDVLSEWITLVVKDKYDLKIRSSFWNEEILELAENNTIDIFILILNNIRVFRSNYSKDFLDDSLELIAKIKTTYGSPVIALYGWPDDPLYLEKVKQVGANFCFKIPCKMVDFEKAVRMCLPMESF